MPYLPLLALPLAVLPVLCDDPELLYQFFMVAYALVFPAYVWIIAQRRPFVSSRRRGIAAWVGFVLVSLPAFADVEETCVRECAAAIRETASS